MTYVSSTVKPQIVKKSISKNVFRYVFKITCKKCGQVYFSEIKSVVKCTFCGEVLSGIPLATGKD